MHCHFLGPETSCLLDFSCAAPSLPNASFTLITFQFLSLQGETALSQQVSQSSLPDFPLHNVFFPQVPLLIPFSWVGFTPQISTHSAFVQSFSLLLSQITSLSPSVKQLKFLFCCTHCLHSPSFAFSSILFPFSTCIVIGLLVSSQVF